MPSDDRDALAPGTRPVPKAPPPPPPDLMPEGTSITFIGDISNAPVDDAHGFLLVPDDVAADADAPSRGSLVPDGDRSTLAAGDGTDGSGGGDGDGDGGALEEKDGGTGPVARAARRRIHAIAASLALLAVVIGIPLSLMALIHGLLPGGGDDGTSNSSSSAATTSSDAIVDSQKRHDPMPTVNLNASEIRTAIWGSSKARIGVTQEEAFADSADTLASGAPSPDLAIPNPPTSRSHHGWVKWYASDGHWRMATDNDDAYIENDFDPMEDKTDQLDVAYDTGDYDVVHALWKKAQDMESDTGYLIVASYKHAYYLVLEGKKGDWTPLRGINSSAPNPRNNSGYPVNMHFEGEMHGDDGPPQEDEGAYKPWKKPIYREDTFYATNVYSGYGLLMHSYHTAWMHPTCVGAYGSVGWGWMLVQDSKWIWDHIPEGTQCVYLTKSEVPNDRPTTTTVTPNGRWKSDTGGHWHYVAKGGGELEGFANDIDEDGTDTGNMDPLHDMAKEYADATSSTEYLVVIDWERCYAGVFQGSANHWVPIRGMNCTTGTGHVTFDAPMGGDGEFIWHNPESEEGWWEVLLTQGHAFHSTVTADPNHGELGRRVSAGVGRLLPENAKWMWDTIPQYTRVICF